MPPKKTVSDDERTLAMLAHLLAIFSGFIGPLVIFILKNKEKGLAYENAKHSLNFQISVIIYYIIAGILILVLVGFLLMIVIAILAFIAEIIGAVRANDGQVYKYPLEIPFFH